MAAPAARAQGKLLHLAIGDPARKDREAPLVLDGITDTRTGETITTAELAARLASTRLLLIGEEHTNTQCHLVQYRVLEALIKSGRRVFVGLEMYPYTEQRFLDQWRDGLLTEEGFVRISRWYDNWGYNWAYYRDIFLLARDHKVPMFAVNTPREVVAAVRKKGLANLTPEEAAHIPKEIDVNNADHMTFFKTTFEGNEGPVHGGGMGDDMWMNMLSAQATWDATMGFNAVEALKAQNDPKAIMVILVGSGHVAYGVGIERQARKWFDGPIASLIPVSVGTPASRPRSRARRRRTRTSPGACPTSSTRPTRRWGRRRRSGPETRQRRVIIVQHGSPAAQAGVKVGDVMQSLDGVRADRQGDVQPPDGGQAVGRLGHARRHARHREGHPQGRVPEDDPREVEAECA